MNENPRPERATLTLHDWIAAPVRSEERLGRLQDAVRELVEKVDRIGGRLGHAEERHDQGVHLIRRLEQKLDALEAKIESMTVLAEEHFTQAVLDPLAERVFTVLDVVEQVRGDGAPEVLAGVESGLLDLLGQLGVSPMQSRPRTPFVARSQKPVHVVPTTDPTLDGCVARCVRLGFRRPSSIVRPEAVAVYRLTQTPEGGAA